jgi:hypothetical protein
VALIYSTIGSLADERRFGNGTVYLRYRVT